MKILYGVQGTGNGHLSRARSMCKHLSNNKQFEVDYLFSGRDRENYYDMDIFGSWQCKSGLTFSVNKGKIQALNTLFNIKVGELFNDIKTTPVEDYDLVVSDYEPITAWAAHKKNIPCLGIGHQYAFNHKIPLKGDNIATRLIMKKFAPTSHNLGLHWYHFQAPILPPIIDTGEHSTGCNDALIYDKQIIVYLPFEDPATISQLLLSFPDYQFLYFGHFDKTETKENITYNPVSRDKFQHDLAQSGGVLCNAGFELASESINLGKKILVKPLHGQMEQISNALALEQLGLGQSVDKLSVPAIQNWLDNFSAKQVKYPDVAKHIVGWIEQGDLNNQKDLIHSLWSKTDSNGLESFKDFDAAY